jgi:LPXTG-motif cell wall-anchored protein
VLAAKPGLCEVVYLGTVVTDAGNPPTLVDRSYAAGSSPWTAAKPNCNAAVVVRDPGPVTPTTVASVSPPTIVTAPAVVTAPAELPNTGSAAVGVGAAIGGALLALGAMVLSAIGRRRGVKVDG